MLPAAPSLAHAYEPRLGRFVSEDRLGEWRLKLYGLAAPERGVRPALVDRTREIAEQSLPDDGAGHGAAFAIAHDARYPIALVYWWHATNELHQRIHVGEPGGLPGPDPLELTPTGCVWELGIVEFERRAWIEHVIGNAAGPDLDAYLGARFDGLV